MSMNLNLKLDWKLSARSRSPLAKIALALLLPLARAQAGVVNCAYDAAGRLVDAEYGAAVNVTYHYDHSGSILHSSTLGASSGDVAVTQSAFPETPIIGVPFEILMTAANTSPGTAASVRLDTQLPAGLAFISASASIGNCSFDGVNLHCELGSLTAGAAAEVTVRLRAAAAGPTGVTTQISASTDLDSSDNSSTLALTVLNPPALTLRLAEDESGPAEITWSARAQSLLLEETESLAPPVIWKTSGPPSLLAGTFQLPVPAETGNRFYRLRLP
jgi:hypothetical protein